MPSSNPTCTAIAIGLAAVAATPRRRRRRPPSGGPPLPATANLQRRRPAVPSTTTSILLHNDDDGGDDGVRATTAMQQQFLRPNQHHHHHHHHHQQPHRSAAARKQSWRRRRRRKSSRTAPLSLPFLLLVFSCCTRLLLSLSDDSPGDAVVVVVHGFTTTTTTTTRILSQRTTTTTTTVPSVLARADPTLRQRRRASGSDHIDDCYDEEPDDDDNNDDDNHHHQTTTSGGDFGKLEQQLQQQQEQINTLLQLLQQQQQQQQQQQHQPVSTSEDSPAVAATTNAQSTIPTQQQQQQALLPPLKAMLFIDGTWLYYSIYERPARDCPLIQKYGRGWQLRYALDWAKLPHILARQLGVIGSHRKVEIVRASVYTSYKADTSPQSYRYKLFQDLQAANYDVHMMETVGRSEKCVDIQLAVEMLHYATTGSSSSEEGSYDVALLLTGDKDFIPAMVRTRQKGKALGLVSMKRGCNRALTDTPGLRDFDVLWLEDYLDEFVVPLPDSEQPGAAAAGGGSSSNRSKVSTFTLYKVLHDFVQTSDYDRVASRDVGRYLKFLHIAGATLLDEIKTNYVGLHQFLSLSGHFYVEHDPFQEDPKDKSYWIGMLPDADAKLLQEARATKFSPEEKLFFQKYNLVALLRAEKDRFYSRTQLQSPANRKTATAAAAAAAATATLSPSEHAPVSGDNPASAAARSVAVQQQQQQQQRQDYSKLTVPELKAICRENGLRVSGVKVALVERIQTHFESQMAAATESQLANGVSPTTNVPPMSSSSNDLTTTPALEYLQSLVEEYLHARGGRASSRDIGRYLAANKPSATGPSAHHQSALQELKAFFGSLRVFVDRHSSGRFGVVEGAEDDSTHEFEFVVGLAATTTAAVNSSSTTSSTVD